MLPGEGRHLGIKRRNLDGKDFRFRLLEGFQIKCQASFRFRFAEDGFTEEIDIHADALGGALAQVAGQDFGLGGEDDVGGFLLHVAFHYGHGDAGQPAAEGLETAQHGAVEGAEKTRHALHIQDMGELIGDARSGMRAEGLIR